MRRSRQVERLNTTRTKRDDISIKSALSDLKAVALTRENLIPFILKKVGF